MDPPHHEPAATATDLVPVVQPVPTTSTACKVFRGPALRPKSAGHLGAGAARRLLLRQPDDAENRIESRTEKSSAVSSPPFPSAASSRRPLTKPRPPSASASICSTTTRKARPHPCSTTPVRTNVPPPNQFPPSGVEIISPRIMREEIETQRKVTRRAQRELNALRVQQTQRTQEIELLTRHLRAFDVETYANPHSPQRSSSSSSGSSTGPSSGSSAGSSGCSSNVSKSTRVDALKDEIRRLDAYKKTLRQLLDRLSRNLQFLAANAELLESQRVAAAREHALVQEKTAQERSLCTELEFKLTQLAEERETHAQHARQLLLSLRTEIQSRALVHQQRSEADHRREEMLRLVESRPGGACSSSSSSSSAPPPECLDGLHRSSSNKTLTMQKRGSHGRRDSFKLLMHESLQFFGSGHDLLASSGAPAPPGGDPTASSPAMLAVATSSRRLQTLRQHQSIGGASFGESLAAAMQRESFYQVYETQYERILEQTGESDLAIVLDRFKSYDETMKRLWQIEKDLGTEHATLGRTRTAHGEHLQQLRLSGIAEVEKRKKIRDFLEQQYHVKSQQRTQANEAFVDHLKTFSYVQQGILNITELLKCLDERFSPPALTHAATATSAASTGSMVHHSVTTAAAIAEIEWLQSLLRSCRTAARSNASPAVVFSLEQIAKLAQIDPTLGSAVRSFAWQSPEVEAAEHDESRAFGSGEQRKSTRQDASEDEEDEDDEDDEDSDVDDRERIKTNERETLEQVELLFRTLDSRQHLARQEQSMHRLRRAFGLSSVGEEDPETSSESPSQENDPQAKLAAVHAFFREKRLREKHEVKRHAVPVGNSHRASLRGQQAAGHAASSAGAPSGGKTAASMALTAFATAAKPSMLRKRSNAVSFAPIGLLQGPPQPKHVTIAPEDTTRRATMATATIKQPTRPPTASAVLTHRRSSNTPPPGQRSGPEPPPKPHQNTSKPTAASQLVVRRPQSSQPKKR